MPDFVLPGVDDPPETEIGVILLGLDAERLLAGLATAARGSWADDPGQVALSVDGARHGTARTVGFDELVREGTYLWWSYLGHGPRPAPVTSASVRDAWTRAVQAVDAAGTGDAGPATRAYRAACWLRRDDIDRYWKERR